jgi:acyl carrier protein
MNRLRQVYMSVRSIILEHIARIAEQQKKTLAPLTDDLPLLESGLDSLCIAILVASLDDSLGVDPFDRDGDIAFPVTLGDFIALYEHATA